MENGITWGTKLKSVRELVAGKADSSIDDCLSYVREISGYVFDLTYYFDDKRLAFITYEYADVPDEDEEALAAWDALRTRLSSEFGSPIKEVERARDSLGEDDLAFWSPSGRVIPFRWAIFENSESRAVLALEGTTNFLISVKAEVIPLG